MLNCGTLGGAYTCPWWGCCVEDKTECSCKDGYYMSKGKCMKMPECNDPMKSINCVEWDPYYYACGKDGCCVDSWDQCSCNGDNDYYKSQWGDCTWSPTDWCHEGVHCGVAGDNFVCPEWWEGACCVSSLSECACADGYWNSNGRCVKLEVCDDPMRMTNCALEWDRTCVPGSCCKESFMDCACNNANDYWKDEWGNCVWHSSEANMCSEWNMTHCGKIGPSYVCNWWDDGCCAPDRSGCACAQGYTHNGERCIKDEVCEMDTPINCLEWDSYMYQCAPNNGTCCAATVEECRCNAANNYFPTEGGWCEWHWVSECTPGSPDFGMNNATINCGQLPTGYTCPWWGCCVEDKTECNCADGYYMSRTGCKKMPVCTDPNKMLNCAGWDDSSCPSEGCCVDSWEKCGCNDMNGYYKDEYGMCIYSPGSCSDMGMPGSTHCGHSGDNYVCTIMGCCMATLEECACAEGYYRNENDRCVKAVDCGEMYPSTPLHCAMDAPWEYVCPAQEDPSDACNAGGNDCCVNYIGECACREGYTKDAMTGECMWEMV